MSIDPEFWPASEMLEQAVNWVGLVKHFLQQGDVPNAYKMMQGIAVSAICSDVVRRAEPELRHVGVGNSVSFLSAHHCAVHVMEQFSLAMKMHPLPQRREARHLEIAKEALKACEKELTLETGLLHEKLKQERDRLFLFTRPDTALTPPNPVTFDDLTKTVSLHGKLFNLQETPKAYQIFKLLCERDGMKTTREDIRAMIPGLRGTNAVSETINQLPPIIRDCVMSRTRNGYWIVLPKK